MTQFGGVDIAAHRIGKREILEIIKNFQGNPNSNSVEARLGEPPQRPADVFCYDNNATDVRRFVANRTENKVTTFDLNRHDWLFSGWADYWAWRAQLRNGRVIQPVNYPVNYPVHSEGFINMANILKAISLREVALGYDMPEGQSLLNLTGGSGYYQLVSNPEPFEQRRRDMVWGLMDVSTSDRPNPQIEVGVVVRVFYANYFYYALRRGAELAGAQEDVIWKQLLNNYGERGIETCYGAKVWHIATEGRWFMGCKGTDIDPSSPFRDFWGR
jgi:hypothetical protein